MRKLSPLFIFVLICQGLVAQEFGGSPPSIRWRQVNTPEVRVIFPSGLEREAIDVAATVRQLSSKTAFSIGTKTRKINIVLQNQTTESNAYVAQAPFRSEFQTITPQNSFELGSLPWTHYLTTHEFRHVQQNNNFNVGFAKVFRVLFGDGGQAVANSLTVPDWFYEGDAVFNETNLSRQGRGRLAFFFNGYRALWESQKDYSWMKLRNGSLRDFVPDFYKLGYMMVAYGREKYGDEFWKGVTYDAASFNGFTYPFQRAITRATGIDYPKFRQDAFNYFQAPLKKNMRPETVREEPKHFRANEENPVAIDDSTLLFARSAYNKIPAFVLRTNGRDRVLRVRDISLDNYFSYAAGKIIYASLRPDKRWGWRDYGELQLLDVQTGSQRAITRHTRYFSPSLRSDGKEIVAVYAEPNGQSRLDIINADSGNINKSILSRDHSFFTYPVFYRDSSIVSCIRNRYGQMALVLFNIYDTTTRVLVPFSYQVMAYPSVSNDTIYFSASHDGRDRLLAYDVTSNKIFLLQHDLLERITGDYRPSATLNRIHWSHFTATGYQLQTLNKKDIRWRSLSKEEFAKPLENFGVSSLEKNPVKAFEPASDTITMPYSKLFHLFNFHSVYPLLDDPVYSLSLVGENILNTLQSEVFLRYNRNEQYKQVGANLVYGAWYPVLSLGGSYSFDRRALYNGKRIYWNETEVRAGLNVPFNFSKGRNLTRLNIGADLVFNQPNFRGVYKDSLGDRSYAYVNSFVAFSNQVQQARQHIYPRFAQTISLNFRKTVTGLEASQWLASGALFLPGFSLNHNLVIQGAYQQRDTLRQHAFTNTFPFSRGYSAESFYHMGKWGVNYHFPLAYPDAGFGNIVYLLRVRANAFYDQTLVTDSRLSQAHFRSTGSELFLDTNWWNQLRVSFGFRYSYLLDPDLFGGAGRNRFEFVLPVNLLGR